MIFLVLIGCYLICGIIFSIVFLLKWIECIDEDSKQTGVAFKLIIAPGCVLFWPLLLYKTFVERHK
jgi:hypothetical protein